MKGRVIIDLSDFNELVTNNEELSWIISVISGATSIVPQDKTFKFVVDTNKLKKLIQKYGLYYKSTEVDDNEKLEVEFV